jgi:hypothetical protein
MKTFLLVSGAAALIAGAPLFAKPGGGHGGGHAAAHGQMGHANVHATKSHGLSTHANSHATTHGKGTKQAKLDRNGNGIADRDEALARKYGGALCPPGLAKKTPACMPPGQAKRLFHEGQRVSSNYRYFTPYGDIPQALVNQYNLSDQYRYIYRNNVIYTVDPRTNLVTQIINAIL